MEIHLDKRALRQIRLSAADAVEEGDTEALREDVLEAFSEEQVEEIERRLDSGDFFEFLTDVLDEWSGDDVDELFELLETQLGDVGIDLKYEAKEAGIAAEEEEEEDDEDFDDDEDEDEDDDDDLDDDDDDLDDDDDDDNY
jgi:Mg/Co/Ni transporter MgtE